MTVKEALEKHHLSFAQWNLFIALARADINPPDRKKGERKEAYRERVEVYLKKSPAWAYVGGMRDSIWAWVGGDRPAYDALEADMTREAAKRLAEVKNA